MFQLSLKLCRFFSLFLLFLKYICLYFHPTMPSTTPMPTSHPQTYPLWLCPCVLYMCSLMALPLLSLSLLLSGYYQFVLYFNVSGSILFSPLFWLGSTHRGDHMVFVLIPWLISLSIILSRSIHAVMKGRSSLFLSAT